VTGIAPPGDRKGERHDARDRWGNERVAFETEIRLNRKDFGLTWNAALETGGCLATVCGPASLD
jgi:polyisoprenoid-binding protein YceI